MRLRILGDDHVRLGDRAALRWVLLALAAGLFAAVVWFGRGLGIDGFWPVVAVLGGLLAVGVLVALLHRTTVEITAEAVRVRRWRFAAGRVLPRAAVLAVELVLVPVAGAPRSRRPLVVEARLRLDAAKAPAVLPLWRSHRIARVCDFASALCAATGLPWCDGRAPSCG